VILRLIEQLNGMRTAVVKFDCLNSFDREQYEAAGIPVVVGYTGKLCPDHFFVTNVQEAFDWARRKNFELLITESAGLCNRCSPHIRGVPAVCVIDNLAGVNTPRKLGPMLRLADIVCVTKGDIVSQAEREVFAYNIRQMNPRSTLLRVNGITGQGAFLLAKSVEQTRELDTLSEMQLRFTTPSSVCAYCTGETRIGMEYQLGMTKPMEFD
jgi:Ni2+-binding GTPase involved in maturation of urease and hydrogenase